uniref:prominin-1-A-like isoform X3 n=1 Tax=Styela clava TaxID=7725 RepID=UPI001939E81E|nr:prominin-1-A-like isoform X3 [Styela clava]
MGKWIILVVAMAATVMTATAQNSTSMFGDLPKGNYNTSDVAPGSSGSMQGLFDMAQGFVNVVFRPFSELADFIIKVFASDSGALDYLQGNWQDAASFEAGYIACLVFGVLFIVFVPLVGSFMCCCRCCCNNCGGRLEQSTKRSKSCWRQCYCVTMLILTTFMAVPTVFVFLTNEWITDVVDTAPVKMTTLLGDTSEYLKLVPRQIQYISDEYATVDNNVRPLVEDFGVSVGVPLQAEIEMIAQPTLDEMDKAIQEVDKSLAAINAVTNSLGALSTGMDTVDKSLTDLQTKMETQLNVSTCTNDTHCRAVYESRTNLTVGFNVTDLDDLTNELDGVNDQLSGYNLTELQQNVTNEINNIPSTTTDQTKAASESAVSALDEANSTMADISSNLPTDKFDEIDQQVVNLQTTITDAFNVYDDNFDQYRYIAGIVLGCMLAWIVFCYLLGMVLGVCGNSRDVAPSQRGCASNCGGIMLMVGVGFSFIFSWLLMILVVVMFTIGGHGERYGCQGLEKPKYEALLVVENVSGINLESTLGLPEGVSLGLVDILNSCENDASAYETFKLEYVLNITEYLTNVTSQTDELQAEVDKATNDIDLSEIVIYTEENQENLLGLMESGLDNIDFNDYLGKSELGDGITKVDLTTYAAFLRAQAAKFTGAVETQFESLVLGYADEVDRIQTDEVGAIQNDYDTLNSSIIFLGEQSVVLNDTILVLNDELTALNGTIQYQGAEIVGNIAGNITDQVIGNVTAYTDWAGQQVTDNLGACKPVYDGYDGVVILFCDYLIDTINGLWFSLGWCVFFLIPSAIVAMKLMKFFRKMVIEEQYEDFGISGKTYISWDDMEMRDYGSPSNNKVNNGYY